MRSMNRTQRERLAGPTVPRDVVLEALVDAAAYHRLRRWPTPLSEAEHAVAEEKAKDYDRAWASMLGGADVERE